jgi:hypothetical protein
MPGSSAELPACRPERRLKALHRLNPVSTGGVFVPAGQAIVSAFRLS